MDRRKKILWSSVPLSGLIVAVTLSVAVAASTGMSGLIPGGVSADSLQANATRPSKNIYPGLHPDKATRSDSDIKADVAKALQAYTDISVAVDNAIVTLSGSVKNEAELEGAVSSARAVSGVRVVQDQIQVKGTDKQTVNEYLDDAGITAAVKSKLLMEKGLSSFHIGVDTEDGVVTLTGTAKSQELADLAGRVASQVKGVKKVDNKLIVKP